MTRDQANCVVRDAIILALERAKEVAFESIYKANPRGVDAVSANIAQGRTVTQILKDLDAEIDRVKSGLPTHNRA